MACADLVARLAQRGAPQPPRCDDLGRDCGPPPPGQLRAAEGSERLRRRTRAFVATVVRTRTVPELREECRRCSLPATGQKEELVERLAETLGGFSTGEACSGTPRKRRLSVKSPETPPKRAEEEQRLLSVRRVSGVKRKRSQEDVCAASPRAACAH